jgi:hypothetical protein
LMQALSTFRGFSQNIYNLSFYFKNDRFQERKRFQRLRFFAFWNISIEQRMSIDSFNDTLLQEILLVPVDRKNIVFLLKSTKIKHSGKFF